MKFLFPTFLWALTSLIIPILIHLFNFRRPKKEYFSNVDLLEEIKTRTSSMQNLKHYLILLSRMLFLAALVFAFAQPYIPAEESRNIGASTKIFYLDNSYSMQTEKDGFSLLENSISGLDEFKVNIASDEEVYLLDNDFNVKDLFPYSKNAFLERLTELDQSHSTRTFDQVLNRIEELETSGKKEIFILSDLQKSTMGKIDAIDIDSNNIIHFIPQKPDEISNIYIDSIWLEKPFVLADEANKLKVRMALHGDEKIENFPVKLFLDNKQAAASNVSLNPNEYTELVFSIPEIPANGLRGMVSVDDSPVFFDNDYYFTIKPIRSINVSLIAESQNQFFDALFKTEGFFNYNFIPSGNPDLSKIKKSDFVILDKMEVLPDFIISSLRDYLQNGGHLLITQPSLAGLEKLLNSFGIRIGILENSPDNLSIKKPDLNNPLFQSVFENLEDNTDMPYGKRAISINNYDQVNLYFEDSNPFLIEKKHSNGRIHVFTGNLQIDKSNLYRHALFVPLMYKLVTGSISENSTALAYNFDQYFIEYSISGDINPEAVLKIKDKELEIIPEQYVSTSGIAFNIPQDQLKPGYYEVYFSDSLMGEIALNVNRKESILDFYSKNEFLKDFPQSRNFKFEDNQDIKSFANAYHQSHYGKELWKYFLICSLIFLLFEILLIRFL